MDDPYDLWKADPTPGNIRKVVDHNRPTINAAIRSYAGNSQSPNIKMRADLLAAEAIQGYDPNKGTQLKSHMMNQLQQLRRYAANVSDPMPKPERLRIESAKAMSQQEEMRANLGREPTVEELAEYGNYDVRKLRKTMMRNRASVPESALVREDGNDDDDYMPGVNRQDPMAIWADVVYHDLSDRDRIIFQHRTGYNGAPIIPNQEIAKKLRLSPAMVSRRAAEIQAQMDQIVEF